MQVSTLEVRKEQWGSTRLVDETLGSTLAENEVLLRVDRLALTANNISYAASGDTLGYWGFFPTEAGWGRIPAMGWGEVIASENPDVLAGERVWGWFPFSTHLKILAGSTSPSTVTDTSAHRSSYAPVYAQFDRASANPIYEQASEDLDSLLRGLFMTSWLVEDFLALNQFFGARNCLITSASSKTSIALAHCVSARGKLASTGITSRGNIAFCESLGCYDRVLAYEDIAGLDSSEAVVMVDMAGSAKVLGDIHRHFRDKLRHSCRIGATHYEDAGSTKGLPGPRPEFFFAPAHVKSRSKELGPKELMTQMGRSYLGFRTSASDWLRVERSFGADAVAKVYQAILSGSADPAAGQIISMWPDSRP